MKPVVHYRKDSLRAAPEVGKQVICDLMNHQNHAPGQRVSNTRPVITSPVVKVGWSGPGSFEILNTRYKPC